jgi:hypothetical protein
MLFAAALLVRAQDVPPPPRPVDTPGAKMAAASLEPGPKADTSDALAKFLESTMVSQGRVSYTLTTRNTKTGETKAPAEAWEEVKRLVIVPGNCEMKVQWNSSDHGDSGLLTAFLEEINEPQAMASQDYLNRIEPDVQHSVAPTVYSVWLPPGATDFKVRDQGAANRVAAALGQLIQQCKASPRPTATSGPSLQETLTFIEDKLNAQGPVNWIATTQNTVAGTSGQPVQNSYQISGVTGDPGACFLKYHSKHVSGGKPSEADSAINLRRVEKIQVMGLQEAGATEYARGGHPELVESISPAAYDLVIADAANRTWHFPSADQDLANRVAKAMLHAVELCGGGKEPF